MDSKEFFIVIFFMSIIIKGNDGDSEFKSNLIIKYLQIRQGKSLFSKLKHILKNHWYCVYFVLTVNIQAHTHHHRVVPLAQISLTFSRHFSLSFIAPARSSGLHPVSSHSYCMYVRAGRPAFARPYVGVHKSTSLMSSSLLPQQRPACLLRLTWIVFVMGGRWPYSWCFWGVAARTYSILLATFLSNCRLSSSRPFC